MQWPLVIILCVLCRIVSCLSSSGNRLLVVVEEVAEKSKYSKFWADLEERGFQLTFESHKSDKLSLFEHGARAFDHIVLLPPKSKGLGPALTPNLLLQFINQEGNLLLALSAGSSTPTAISSILLELDIHLAPGRTSLVVDHFNHDALSSADRHDVLLLSQPSPSRPDIQDFFGGDGVIAFPRAVAQELGNSSPLLSTILGAKTTAYSYNPKDDAEPMQEPFAVGEQISLVSSLQSRNSARFTVFGSAEALEDHWFDAKIKDVAGKQSETANRKFAAQVSAWTFKEAGVVKVGRVEHHLSTVKRGADGNDSVAQLGYLNPTIYRIKNEVTFDIELSEYSVDHLRPFKLGSLDAVQLEFTMLSPYHRLNLHPVGQTVNSTIYSTTFKLPDQHGIFSFRVNYKRPFLTNIDVKREVTVRHFAHDEWPRSWEITAGWVWIAGIWINVIGWIAFVSIWLYSEPAYEDGKGKKTQ